MVKIVLGAPPVGFLSYLRSLDALREANLISRHGQPRVVFLGIRFLQSVGEMKIR